MLKKQQEGCHPHNKISKALPMLSKFGIRWCFWFITILKTKHEQHTPNNDKLHLRNQKKALLPTPYQSEPPVLCQLIQKNCRVIRSYNFELHPPVALAIIFLSLEHTNDVVLLNETFRWLGCQLAFVVWHCSFHCFSPKVPCRHAVRFPCVKKCCQLCLVIQEFWFFIVPLPRGCQVVGVLRRKKPGNAGW